MVLDNVASKYSKIMTQAKSVLERYMTKLQIIHSNEIMVVKHAKKSFVREPTLDCMIYARYITALS